MIKDKLKHIFKLKNITAAQVANHLGTTPQSLSNKFSRNTLLVSELIEIMDFLDCDIVINPRPGFAIKLTTDDVEKEK